MLSSVRGLNKVCVRVSLALIALFVLSGCISKPIYNVESQTFSTSKPLPITTVQETIKIIGANRGWIFQDVAPGHMVGKVGTIKHTARVNLRFTDKTFSIKYIDSVNLKARHGTIHHRYNRWIQLLEQDLVAKLGLVAQSQK